MKNIKEISAEKFDSKLEAGEEIFQYFDLENVTRPNKSQRLTLHLPGWTVAALDKEARALALPAKP